jgi:hypothetical protein
LIFVLPCRIGKENLEFWKQKNGGQARRAARKMEKYRLVEEHKGEGEDFLEQTSEAEVRITQQGKPRNYISYAMNLFVSWSALPCLAREMMMK